MRPTPTQFDAREARAAVLDNRVEGTEGGLDVFPGLPEGALDADESSPDRVDEPSPSVQVIELRVAHALSRSHDDDRVTHSRGVGG